VTDTPKEGRTPEPDGGERRVNIVGMIVSADGAVRLEMDDGGIYPCSPQARADLVSILARNGAIPGPQLEPGEYIAHRNEDGSLRRLVLVTGGAQ